MSKRKKPTAADPYAGPRDDEEESAAAEHGRVMTAIGYTPSKEAARALNTAMTIGREHGLIAELRDAREKVRAYRAQRADVKQELRDLDERIRDAESEVEEILMELETGSSGRPLIDRCGTMANGNDDGDGEGGPS